MRTMQLILNCVTSKLIAVTVLFALSISSLSGQNQAPPDVKKTFTVVIDPGHGGKHPGAVGKISKEKDVVLAIALKTGEYISSLMDDVEVIFTRTKDVYVDLYKRAEIANDINADLFISIHANGNNNSSIYGAETYVMGPSKSEKNLQVAIKENSVIKIEENQDQYEGFNPDNPEDYIKFSLYQNTFMLQSLFMASEVQDQLRIRGKRKDGGVRQGPFLVLWRTTMPSVLIETGYLSNSDEEKYLNTDNGQDIIASAIYRAFRNYKVDHEKKTAENKKTVETDNSLELEKILENTQIKEIAEKKEEKTAIVDSQPKEKPVIKTVNENKTQSNDAENLVFRIQVIASKEPIPKNSKHLQGEKELEEFFINGYYKYMTGPISSYSQSQIIQKKLSSKFPGAFIIASFNGEKIPLKEAISLEKEK